MASETIATAPTRIMRSARSTDLASLVISDSVSLSFYQNLAEDELPWKVSAQVPIELASDPSSHILGDYVCFRSALNWFLLLIEDFASGCLVYSSYRGYQCDITVLYRTFDIRMRLTFGHRCPSIRPYKLRRAHRQDRSGTLRAHSKHSNLTKQLQGRQEEIVDIDTLFENRVYDIYVHLVPLDQLEPEGGQGQALLEPKPSLVLTLPTPELPSTPTFIPQSPITIPKYVTAAARTASSLATVPPMSSPVPSVPSCGVCSLTHFEQNMQCRMCDRQWLACKVWYQATDGGRHRWLKEPYIRPGESNASNRAIMEGLSASSEKDPRGLGIQVLPLPSRKTWFRRLSHWKSFLQDMSVETELYNDETVANPDLLSVPCLAYDPEKIKELFSSSCKFPRFKVARFWDRILKRVMAPLRLLPSDSAPRASCISKSWDSGPSLDALVLGPQYGPACCLEITSGSKFVELGV